MSEEKKEYNTMEEGNISSKEAGEILEEDDVNLAEEAVSKEESSETEDSAAEQEEKTSEKKGLFGKRNKAVTVSGYPAKYINIRSVKPIQPIGSIKLFGE